MPFPFWSRLIEFNEPPSAGGDTELKIFWAWQSDLPGKVSRHFVRDALEAAIQRLNDDPDIEEPAERGEQAPIHLDSDRQGVPGSPDLSATILKKIAESSVFVADVTPVGQTCVSSKKLMNPNVAIELGYAIGKLTDERVLFVLNEAYGSRDDLPFDIRHKAGPVMYRLPDGATKNEIDAESRKLIPKFTEALRLFKSQESVQKAEPFPETPAVDGRAFFFDSNEIIGRNQYRPERMYRMTFRRAMYLRVMPSERLPRPTALSNLLKNGARCGCFGDSAGAVGPTDLVRENEYGVSVICLAGDTLEIGSMTQLFRTGELWGINADIISRADEGNVPLIGSWQLEDLFRRHLPMYLDFLGQFLDYPGPYLVEAGVQGVHNYLLGHNGYHLDNTARLARDTISLRRELPQAHQATQDRFLLSFFERVHDETGHRRPDNLYGFPRS